MTVSISTNRYTYPATGSQTTFPFECKIFVDTDLTVLGVDSTTGVISSTYVLDTDYTVSGTIINDVMDYTDGGSVIFDTAPTSGQTIVVWATYDYEQSIDLVQGDSFPANVLEGGLDKLTLLAIKSKDENNRSIKFSPASTATDVYVPDPEAGKIVGWDNDGKSMVNIENPASAAATSASQAATSASQAASSASDASGYSSTAESYANNAQTLANTALDYVATASGYAQDAANSASILQVNDYEENTTSVTDLITVPFTLTGTYINVTLDGVRQSPSAYTVSGTSDIHLSETIASGTNVYVSNITI